MRYVLLLQGERASAFAVGRGEYAAPVVFEKSESGREKFCLYLQERYRSLFTLVLDSRDEEHHLGSVPKLRRADRNRMLTKLQRKHFPDDSLSVVTMAGKFSTDVTATQVTVSGISDQSDCHFWLALIERTSTLVTAIYSLSLLGHAIDRAHGGSKSLCVVQLGQNDFRLIAYQNSRLLISRHLTVTDNVAEALLQQLGETQNYLNRLSESDFHDSGSTSEKPHDGSILKNWTTEDVWVIGGISALGKTILEDSGIRVISCRNMARIMGIKREMTPPFADTLFVDLAWSGKSLKRSFSLGAYQNSFRARRIRHALFAGCICCFGITFVATAAAMRVNHAISTLTSAVEKSARIVHRDDVAVNDQGLPVDAIRESMQFAKYIDSQSQFTPQHFLYSFARDLTIYPELEVTGIHWSRTDEARYKNIPGEIFMRKGEDNNHEFLQIVQYSATINGHMRTDGLERIAALDRFNNFISTLIKAGRYSSVTVIEAPFGVGDNAVTIGGGLAEDRENFTIELNVQQEAE